MAPPDKMKALAFYGPSGGLLLLGSSLSRRFFKACKVSAFILPGYRR
jgi:hypothetical protein